MLGGGRRKKRVGPFSLRAQVGWRHFALAWLRRHSLVLAILLGCIALGAGLWFVFVLLPQIVVPDASHLSRDEFLQRQQDVRGSGLQALAGLVVAAGAAFTAYSVINAREGQLTERFTRAIDHLGSPQADIRIGGIHALGRIGQDSWRDRRRVIDVLTAFITSPNGHKNSSSAPHDLISAKSIAIKVSTELWGRGEPGMLRLRSADLRKVSFAELDLTCVDFSKAQCMDATFTRCDLRGVRMGRSELRSANLWRVNAARAKLSLVDLTDALLDDACLAGANLKSATLTEARLHRAELPEVTAPDAKFIRAVLTAVDLRQAFLRRADFTDARLIGADLREADMRRSRAPGADLRRADLRSADLTAASLEGANLDGADLRGASLHGAKLKGASLRGADLRGADLTSAHMREAVLARALFDEALLWKANLSRVKARGANFDRAKLRLANLDGAEFWGGSFLGADLQQAQLSRTVLRAASLSGAKFGGARLAQANLLDTDLSAVEWRGLKTGIASSDGKTFWPPSFDPAAQEIAVSP